MIRYRDLRSAEYGPLDPVGDDLTRDRWTFRLDDGNLDLLGYEQGTCPLQTAQAVDREEARGTRSLFERLFRIDPED